MSTDYYFHKAVTSWGDGVVKPSHLIHLQTWLDNPLTKALKQSHRRQLEEDEALLRQCLEALIWEVGSEPTLYAAQTAKAITALRERLEGEA